MPDPCEFERSDFLKTCRTLLDEDAASSLCGLATGALAGKSVLVTGASGLVGTHFLAGLLHIRQTLGSSLSVDAVVRQDIPRWISPDPGTGVRIHQGDLTDPDFVNRLPSADIVIHAATYGQPARFMAEPAGTLKLNTVATCALLDRVRPDGKFLFLSSSELYSGLKRPPFTEEQIGTTNTDHPRACYIEGKRCGEAICNSYRRLGVDAKSVRLALAWGPGTRPGDKRVLNSFIEQALQKKEIRLLDAGRALRTYCYISDAMFMLWRILLEGRDSLYNVGGVWRTSIADLGACVAKLLQVPLHVPDQKLEALQGSPDDVYVSVRRFEREFGPVRFMSPGEGLGRTVQWQRFIYDGAL
jgi:UDP-glucuronate decarboxylase